MEYRHPEFFSRNAQALCEQFPSKKDGITLEIITKTKVTQHFKESVMTSGIADIIQVIMFTACANAALYTHRTIVSTLILT